MALAEPGWGAQLCCPQARGSTGKENPRGNKDGDLASKYLGGFLTQGIEGHWGKAAGSAPKGNLCLPTCSLCSAEHKLLGGLSVLSIPEMYESPQNYGIPIPEGI